MVSVACASTSRANSGFVAVTRPPFVIVIRPRAPDDAAMSSSPVFVQVPALIVTVPTLFGDRATKLFPLETLTVPLDTSNEPLTLKSDASPGNDEIHDPPLEINTAPVE